MTNFFDMLSECKGQLSSTMIEHIQISFIALLITTAIAIPLGVLLTKVRTISKTVMNTTATLQTIPSLALLGLMIPLLSIGRVSAITAFVVYALLLILGNTYTGIKGVDPLLIEAAEGIGMRPFRRLARVEFLTTMSVIMTGVGTVMVLTIGTATLAALIGAGGLGDLILLGIGRNNVSLMSLGVAPAVLLAIISDLILRFMAKLSYKKLLMTLGVIVMIIILATAIPMLAQKGDKIMLAEKSDSEPSIITNMRKILIEKETKNTIEVKDGMGKITFLSNVLKSDDIDGYLEFTGTVLGELTKEPLKSKEEKEVYEQAKQSPEKKY